MWDIAEVKARGREAFKANYWPCVIVALIYTLLMGGGVAATSNQGSNAVTNTTYDESAVTSTTYDESAVTSSTADDDSIAVTSTTDDADGLSDDQKAALAAVALVGALIALVVSLVVKVFITNPITVGSARFFQKNIEHNGEGVGTIVEGFGNYGHVFCTLFLRDIFIGLWTLLFVIPGIMHAYSYRLVPYIVKDEPDLSATEVLARSSMLMRGNRWKSFLLDLSFIGWVIFGCVTLGLGMILWTSPYMQSTNAALYLELKNE